MTKQLTKEEIIFLIYPGITIIDGDNCYGANGKELSIKIDDELIEQLKHKPSDFHVLKNKIWVRDDDAFKKHLQKQLMTLVDTKQEEAEHLILGYKATPKQIERYKDKYQRAKDGEFKAQENQMIIAKYEAMLAAIRQFVDLIEAFRAAVDDLLTANQLDKAEQAINAGKAFNASTKPGQIKQLFKQLGAK